jgi:hypothetical protein
VGKDTWRCVAKLPSRGEEWGVADAPSSIKRPGWMLISVVVVNYSSSSPPSS